MGAQLTIFTADCRLTLGIVTWPPVAGSGDNNTPVPSHGGLVSMLRGVPGRVAGRCVSICLVAICGMSARGDNKPIPGRISVICQVSSLLLQSAVSWPDRDVRPDMTAGVVCGHWSLGTSIQ